MKEFVNLDPGTTVSWFVDNSLTGITKLTLAADGDVVEAKIGATVTFKVVKIVREVTEE